MALAYGADATPRADPMVRTAEPTMVPTGGALRHRTAAVNDASEPQHWTAPTKRQPAAVDALEAWRRQAEQDRDGFRSVVGVPMRKA